MSNPTNKIKQVYVVSHTHWDREWYQDFQSYRVRLVYLIDELLEMMESNPEYRYFMMDGQTIIIDDYLEIRPENKERIMKLIQEGRIKVGPWYVMPDEFLVSGESLIRNFLIGYRKARSWGAEPMKSGYIPDIFGHNSQFPQILQGFGIDNAVLFRGFRGDGDASEIIWEGADGSQVIGLKLDEDRSYGDFYFFLRWPFTERDFQYDRAELIERAQSMLQYKNSRATTDMLLGLDGIDHIEIEPQLPWMLTTLNEAEDLGGVEFIHTHLEHYVADLRKKLGTLTVFHGEQRSPGYVGVNNWVLGNVLSSRVHLKQLNQQCENLLERWAEPWGVFTALEGRGYPKAFLDRAWESLIQNHPHDSICGCSIDQVHRDMIYRFDQSKLIAEQMIHEQLTYVSNHMDTKGLTGERVLTLFNASAQVLDEVVETQFSLPAHIQGVSPALMGTLFRIYDEQGEEVQYQLLSVKKNSMHRFRPYRDIPHGEMVDRYRIALPAQIPAHGYSTYVIKRIAHELHGPGEYNAPRMERPYRNPGTMRVQHHSWDNGKLRLNVNADGSITIKDHATGKVYGPLLVFEDEADIGEGWNHVSPVTNQVFVSTGCQSNLSVVYDGPFALRIEIELLWRLPASINASGTARSAEMIEIPIRTQIDMFKDDPQIRCRTTIENRAKDHRLKALFITGIQTESYSTSTPFDLVRREVKKTDYSAYMEKAREEVPNNGIISMNDDTSGLAIYSKGLYETQVRDDLERTIALTLYRSTGSEVLSDGSDGGQLLRELTFEYAIRPFAVNKHSTGALFQEYHRYAAGIRAVDRSLNKVIYEVPHRYEHVQLPTSFSFLSSDNPNFVISAVKAADASDAQDVYIIRLWNASEQAESGALTFGKQIVKASKVTLEETEAEALAAEGHKLSLTLQPKQIVSVAVRFA